VLVLNTPAPARLVAMLMGNTPMLNITLLERRKLNLKAKFEGGSSYHSFKRLVPGAFNVGSIGSTCTALPCSSR
jgi:hypothetical protein